MPAEQVYDLDDVVHGLPFRSVFQFWPLTRLLGRAPKSRGRCFRPSSGHLPWFALSQLAILSHGTCKCRGELPAVVLNLRFQRGDSRLTRLKRTPIQAATLLTLPAGIICTHVPGIDQACAGRRVGFELELRRNSGAFPGGGHMHGLIQLFWQPGSPRRFKAGLPTTVSM